MKIADRELGVEPFIVAEVGVNHDGSIARAIKMIHVAAECGVDAVKFGIFKADEFCRPNDPLYETFKRCELPESAWFELKQECEKAGVIFFATPQNESDLDVLLKVGVPCVKIGSDDLTNIDLVRRYAKTGLPLILSSGMADWEDVDAAWLATLEVSTDRPLVCVCTSEYPCPLEHANVRRLEYLRWMIPGTLLGFSDHTVGTMAATVACALGACYFEKHFTMSKLFSGPDHHFSADPKELREWVQAIRQAKVALGDGQVSPTDEERSNRDKWRRKSGQQLRGVA